MEILVVISIWFVMGVVGGFIGQQHGKTGKGFALGFLFGPIGWAMALFDIGLASFLLTFLAVVLIGYFVVDMIIAGNRSAERKREEIAQRQAEQLRDPDEESDQVLKSVTAPTPSPTPVRTPTPQEITARQAQEAQRRAAEIARKYAPSK
jgi:hypothetical protein